MSKIHPKPPHRRRQTGAVLFLAMIFLVLLAVLAVTASSTSIMQERMAGGLRNQQLGLLGAESTLRGGEAFLWNLSFAAGQPLPPCLPTSTGTDCAYVPTHAGTLLPKVQAFRTSRDGLDPATDGARAYQPDLTGLTGNAITANLAAQPRYIIEYLGVGAQPFRSGGSVHAQGTSARVGEQHIYRITARSPGGSNTVVRVAESYYSAMNLTHAPFNPDAPSSP